MIKIKKEGIVKLEDIRQIISKYPNEKICIVIDNTKYQSPEILEQIAKKYPNVIFSVLGGLNPQKRKFNNEYYQSRTYYNSMELSKIIRIYQLIERKIDLSWTDTQKVMFVYQQLCNRLVYSECEVNGRDCCRCLSGLIYGKAVCSGFAMIFKEALDRLGFKNIYQNKEGMHSWNIAYIDGAYRAFELTWDTYKKKDTCGFIYFNRDENFYHCMEHDLSYEQEEQEYEIVPYKTEDLVKDLQIISSPKILTYPIQNGQTPVINFIGKAIQFRVDNKEIWVNGISNYKKFVRSDGSIFILIYVSSKDNLNKFYYFEPQDGKNQVRGTRIYSELRLDALSENYDYTIANGLLSRERLQRKINNFNGYVGYFGTNQHIYYNSDFEREKLNIIR